MSNSFEAHEDHDQLKSSADKQHPDGGGGADMHEGVYHTLDPDSTLMVVIDMIVVITMVVLILRWSAMILLPQHPFHVSLLPRRHAACFAFCIFKIHCMKMGAEQLSPHPSCFLP